MHFDFELRYLLSVKMSRKLNKLKNFVKLELPPICIMLLS